MYSGERGKRNYQEHEEASFFHLSEFQDSFFILFLRKRLIHFLCGLLLLLFLQESIQTGIQRCSTKQMILKTLPLAIFTGTHLCWRFFLINFIKKRLQHRCFPMNIANCLSTGFYKEQLPFIMLFGNFMCDRITLDLFRYKIDIFHISCVIALFSFVTLVLEQENHRYFIYILFLYQNFY